jgi:hypothetical protein
MILLSIDNASEIIAQKVEDEGMCRFAIIPDGVVKPEEEDDDMEDEMGKSIESNLVDEVVENLL